MIYDIHTFYAQKLQLFSKEVGLKQLLTTFAIWRCATRWALCSAIGFCWHCYGFSFVSPILYFLFMLLHMAPIKPWEGTKKWGTATWYITDFLFLQVVWGESRGKEDEWRKLSGMWASWQKRKLNQSNPWIRDSWSRRENALISTTSTRFSGN